MLRPGAGADHAGHVASLLHRDRCDAGQYGGLAVSIAHADHVADREDLRVAGKRQVGLDGDPAGAVDARRRSARRASRRGCDAVTPAAQTTVRLAMRSACRLVARGHAVARRSPITVRPVSTVTPSRSSDRSAFADSDGGNVVSTRSAASMSRTRARRDRSAEVAPQRVVRELCDLAGHLDAGRAGADDDEREPAPRALGVGLDLGGLEGAEERPRRRARSRATSPRRRAAATPRGRSTSSASRRRRSACRTRVAPAPARRRPSADAARALEVEVGDVGQQDADVAVALEDRAQRIGDLAGRERAGGDLVDERLEEVEVARSTSVTSTGARRSFETAWRPPKPPPTTTTWCSGVTSTVRKRRRRRKCARGVDQFPMHQ